MTALDDMNAAIDRLGAEVKLDTAVLDELAGMVRAAGPGGAIPADQVAALVTRVDSVTGELTASRTADTPATPAASTPTTGGSPTVADPTGGATPGPTG